MNCMNYIIYAYLCRSDDEKFYSEYVMLCWHCYVSFIGQTEAEENESNINLLNDFRSNEKYSSRGQ